MCEEVTPERESLMTSFAVERVAACVCTMRRFENKAAIKTIKRAKEP